MTRLRRNRINNKSTSSTSDMGKAAKETSELVDIDPNKNRRMREQSLSGNAKISGRSKTPSGNETPLDRGSDQQCNSELNRWKEKRKRRRKRQKMRLNSLQSNGTEHHPRDDTSMKNSSLEKNSDMCTVDGAVKTGLETAQLAGLSSWPGMEKRKRNNQKRRHNALKSNVIHRDHPAGTSSMKNTSLERDSFPQPPVNIRLKADSEMMQYDSEVSLSQDMSDENEQNKACNASESNSINHDLQEGVGRHSLDLTNIKDFEEVDVNSVSAVAEQVSTFSKCADTSSTRKHDDHAEADSLDVGSIRTYQRRKRVKTYRRKKRKVPKSLGNSLESIEEGAGSAVLVVENKLGDTSLVRSDGLASGYLENMLERKVVAGYGTLLQVVEDISIEKTSGGCSDGQPASEESKKRIEMETLKQTIYEDGSMNNISAVDLEENFEQANKCKINVIKNAVQDVCSPEEIFYESPTSFREDKAFANASDSDLFHEPLDKKILETQSKMEDAISSSTQLGVIKDDISLVINKEDHSLDVVQSSPERALTDCFRRKLLILDVNGLLADIVAHVSDGYEADTIIAKKAVFKRPFCDDFLQFCFERFNVGVWSSRTKRNVESVLDFLMGKTKNNLVFCWDQSHCTETGYNTVENKEKPLLLKELKKLWEKHEPSLPWERGEYNESNTLLLDDSPYKALCNPPNTAIFPHTYRYKDVKDNSLGPGGDLRVYLEGLSSVENVQKYVEHNPFGQRPITERNLSWAFYLKVISTVSSQKASTVSSQPEADANNSSACQ